MKTGSKLVTVILTSGMIVAGLAGFAGPAQAVPVTGDTLTTFTLTGGALAITAPASSALGSVATGTSTTAATLLGVVTVSDGRGALLGSWTTSVTSSDYNTGGSTSNETIANANADYWSGLQTAGTGVAVRVPGQLAFGNAVTLASSRTAFSATGVVGNNTTSWNPTVTVNIPAAAVAGAYTGTITHSLA
ncbi:MAG TPA: hypothetical protein VHT97_10995 [Acidimicrobiales bacterium]|nr:hypothetical protein [Acidimicrobiales bacterium]